MPLVFDNERNLFNAKYVFTWDEIIGGTEKAYAFINAVAKADGIDLSSPDIPAEFIKQFYIGFRDDEATLSREEMKVAFGGVFENNKVVGLMRQLKLDAFSPLQENYLVVMMNVFSEGLSDSLEDVEVLYRDEVTQINLTEMLINKVEQDFKEICAYIDEMVRVRDVRLKLSSNIESVERDQMLLVNLIRQYGELKIEYKELREGERIKQIVCANRLDKLESFFERIEESSLATLEGQLSDIHQRLYAAEEAREEAKLETETIDAEIDALKREMEASKRVFVYTGEKRTEGITLSGFEKVEQTFYQRIDELSADIEKFKFREYDRSIEVLMKQYKGLIGSNRKYLEAQKLAEIAGLKKEIENHLQTIDKLDETSDTFDSDFRDVCDELDKLFSGNHSGLENSLEEKEICIKKKEKARKKFINACDQKQVLIEVLNSIEPPEVSDAYTLKELDVALKTVLEQGESVVQSANELPVALFQQVDEAFQEGIKRFDIWYEALLSKRINSLIVLIEKATKIDVNAVDKAISYGGLNDIKDELLGKIVEILRTPGVPQLISNKISGVEDELFVTLNEKEKTIIALFKSKIRSFYEAKVELSGKLDGCDPEKLLSVFSDLAIHEPSVETLIKEITQEKSEIEKVLGECQTALSRLAREETAPFNRIIQQKRVILERSFKRILIYLNEKKEQEDEKSKEVEGISLAEEIGAEIDRSAIELVETVLKHASELEHTDMGDKADRLFETSDAILRAGIQYKMPVRDVIRGLLPDHIGLAYHKPDIQDECRAVTQVLKGLLNRANQRRFFRHGEKSGVRLQAAIDAFGEKAFTDCIKLSSAQMALKTLIVDEIAAFSGDQYVLSGANAVLKQHDVKKEEDLQHKLLEMVENIAKQKRALLEKEIKRGQRYMEGLNKDIALMMHTPSRRVFEEHARAVKVKAASIDDDKSMLDRAEVIQVSSKAFRYDLPIHSERAKLQASTAKAIDKLIQEKRTDLEAEEALREAERDAELARLREAQDFANRALLKSINKINDGMLKLKVSAIVSEKVIKEVEKDINSEIEKVKVSRADSNTIANACRIYNEVNPNYDIEKSYASTNGLADALREATGRLIKSKREVLLEDQIAKVEQHMQAMLADIHSVQRAQVFDAVELIEIRLLQKVEKISDDAVTADIEQVVHAGYRYFNMASASFKPDLSLGKNRVQLKADVALVISVLFKEKKSALRAAQIARAEAFMSDLKNGLGRISQQTSLDSLAHVATLTRAKIAEIVSTDEIVEHPDVLKAATAIFDDGTVRTTRAELRQHVSSEVEALISAQKAKIEAALAALLEKERQQAEAYMRTLKEEVGTIQRQDTPSELMALKRTIQAKVEKIDTDAAMVERLEVVQAGSRAFENGIDEKTTRAELKQVVSDKVRELVTAKRQEIEARLADELLAAQQQAEAFMGALKDQVATIAGQGSIAGLEQLSAAIDRNVQKIDTDRAMIEQREIVQAGSRAFENDIDVKDTRGELKQVVSDKVGELVARKRAEIEARIAAELLRNQQQAEAFMRGLKDEVVTIGAQKTIADLERLAARIDRSVQQIDTDVAMIEQPAVVQVGSRAFENDIDVKDTRAELKQSVSDKVRELVTAKRQEIEARLADELLAAQQQAEAFMGALKDQVATIAGQGTIAGLDQLAAEIDINVQQIDTDGAMVDKPEVVQAGSRAFENGIGEKTRRAELKQVVSDKVGELVTAKRAEIEARLAAELLAAQRQAEGFMRTLKDQVATIAGQGTTAELDQLAIEIGRNVQKIDTDDAMVEQPAVVQVGSRAFENDIDVKDTRAELKQSVSDKVTELVTAKRAEIEARMAAELLAAQRQAELFMGTLKDSVANIAGQVTIPDLEHLATAIDAQVQQIDTDRAMIEQREVVQAGSRAFENDIDVKDTRGELKQVVSDKVGELVARKRAEIEARIAAELLRNQQQAEAFMRGLKDEVATIGAQKTIADLERLAARIDRSVQQIDTDRAMIEQREIVQAGSRAFENDIDVKDTRAELKQAVSDKIRPLMFAQRAKIESDLLAQQISDAKAHIVKIRSLLPDIEKASSLTQLATVKRALKDLTQKITHDTAMVEKEAVVKVAAKTFDEETLVKHKIGQKKKRAELKTAVEKEINQLLTAKQQSLNEGQKKRIPEKTEEIIGKPKKWRIYSSRYQGKILDGVSASSASLNSEYAALYGSEALFGSNRSCFNVMAYESDMSNAEYHLFTHQKLLLTSQAGLSYSMEQKGKSIQLELNTQMLEKIEGDSEQDTHKRLMMTSIEMVNQLVPYCSKLYFSNDPYLTAAGVLYVDYLESMGLGPFQTSPGVEGLDASSAAHKQAQTFMVDLRNSNYGVTIKDQAFFQDALSFKKGEDEPHFGA